MMLVAAKWRSSPAWDLPRKRRRRRRKKWKRPSLMKRNRSRRKRKMTTRKKFPLQQEEGNPGAVVATGNRRKWKRISLNMMTRRIVTMVKRGEVVLARARQQKARVRA